MVDILSGAPEAFLHPDEATRIGVRPLDRLRVRAADNDVEFTAVVNVTPSIVKPGTLGLSRDLAVRMGIQAGGALVARPAPRPASVDFIRRKLDGQVLSATEMTAVIHDIAGGHLTPVELTCWAVAVHTRGMSIDETVACVQAMVNSGDRLNWNGTPVYDVHSIGGVPGNKYAPIVVAIAAAVGLKIPKTSSRAISSACGTADFVEVLAPVALTSDQLRQVVERTGACLAWGGGVALAPADDEIIRVEYPLGLDPPDQIVASVLAKKVAMGVTDVLIDLPTGPGAKVRDQVQAQDLVRRFTEVGAKLGLRVQCMITAGSRPLGRAIGPSLEAKEMLQVLEAGDGPADLVDKSLKLAGQLLEMSGKATPGNGRTMALAFLRNGSAHAKLLDILTAQGGAANLRSGDIQPGPFTFVVEAIGDSRVEIPNTALVAIARAAGAPHAKGAGLQLLHRPGDPLAAGQPIFVVHAETQSRLTAAWDATQRLTALKCRAQGGSK